MILIIYLYYFFSDKGYGNLLSKFYLRNWLGYSFLLGCSYGYDGYSSYW